MSAADLVKSFRAFSGDLKDLRSNFENWATFRKRSFIEYRENQHKTLKGQNEILDKLRKEIEHFSSQKSRLFQGIFID